MKNRVKVIEKFIKIAKISRKLGNYNTLLAIISGLNLVSVSRLKATWEAVDSKRTKQLEELEAFLSPANNYKAYRAHMDDTDYPQLRIPILSLFIKDLFFTNDGNSTYSEKLDEKGNKLINMEKLETIYKKTNTFVKQFKNPLPIREKLDQTNAQFVVNNMRSLKEQALYKYSCLCEPKSGDTDTLRLREKWMSGSSWMDLQ